MRLTLSSILLLIACTANAQTLYRQNSATKNTLYTVTFPGDSANVGLAAGASGTLVTTNDGGQNWQGTALGTGNLYASYFNDTSSGAIGGESGVLVIKIPGQSPFPVQLSLAEPIRGITYSTYDTAVCVGMSGLIFITRDSGKTWSKIKPPALLATHDFYGVNWFDDSTYWIVGAGGIVLYTEDAGTTWQRITVPTTKDLYSISFPSDGVTGWIAGDQTLLYTTDIGDTWTSIPTTASLRYVDGYGDTGVTTNEIGYAVGLNGTLLTTSDLIDWAPMTTGTSANLYGLDFPDSLYVVGDSGIILTTLPPPIVTLTYSFTVGSIPYWVQQVGDSSTKEIYVDNTGTGTLTITNISVVADQDFTLDSPTSFPIKLNPQDSLAVTIKFAPLVSHHPAGSIRVFTAEAGEVDGGIEGTAIGVLPSSVTNIRDQETAVPIFGRDATSSAIYIEPFIESSRLSIVNVIGEVVWSDALSGSTGPIRTSLPAGFYFYRVTWPGGAQTGKFILP